MSWQSCSHPGLGQTERCRTGIGSPVALNKSQQRWGSVAGKARQSEKARMVNSRSPGKAGMETGVQVLRPGPRGAGTGWQERPQRQNPSPQRGEKGGQ